MRTFASPSRSLSWCLVGCVAILPTAASAEPAAGFRSLFNGKDLEGWQGDVNGYEAVAGEIRSKKGVGGNLLTKEEFSDFILKFDFRLTPGANNGLGIRAPNRGDVAFSGIELQILDDGHEKYAKIQPWQVHGSIYGVVPASRDCLKPTGEWNTEEVTVQGSRIKVVVNGKQIVDADVAPYRDGKPTPDGKAHPGLSRTSGHVGFLGHGDEVHFRAIQIRDLTVAPTPTPAPAVPAEITVSPQTTGLVAESAPRYSPCPVPCEQGASPCISHSGRSGRTDAPFWRRRSRRFR